MKNFEKLLTKFGYKFTGSISEKAKTFVKKIGKTEIAVFIDNSFSSLNSFSPMKHPRVYIGIFKQHAKNASSYAHQNGSWRFDCMTQKVEKPAFIFETHPAVICKSNWIDRAIDKMESAEEFAVSL